MGRKGLNLWWSVASGYILSSPQTMLTTQVLLYYCVVPMPYPDGHIKRVLIWYFILMLSLTRRHPSPRLTMMHLSLRLTMRQLGLVLITRYLSMGLIVRHLSLRSTMRHLSLGWTMRCTSLGLTKRHLSLGSTMRYIRHHEPH